MKTIALIIMWSIVLEALVEYAKTIMHMVEEKQYKTAITQAITIAAGIWLAFQVDLQLFNGAMSEVYEGLSIDPVIDMTLTGILFSRGSNYMHDFIRRLQKPNDSEGQYLAVNEDGTEVINDIFDEDWEDEVFDDGIAND